MGAATSESPPTPERWIILRRNMTHRSEARREARDPRTGERAWTVRGGARRECAVGVVLPATIPAARVEAATLARSLGRLRADLALLRSCAPHHATSEAPRTSRLAWALLGLTTTGAIGLLGLSLQLVARAGI